MWGEVPQRRLGGDRGVCQSGQCSVEGGAMQASDWAFMVTRDLAGDYPGERMKLHGDALDAALAALTDSAAAPEPSLRGLAPHLDMAPLTTP